MKQEVAIIIPTYNRAPVLGHAIRSVLEQDYENVDLIVVDDGSQDDTSAVIRGFADKRLRAVRLPTNRGVTAAKNAGIDAIRRSATYVGILDSDDKLAPLSLSRLVAGFSESPGNWSQVYGWCEDLATKERTGRCYSGRVLTFEDAIRGKIVGEFWQLARADCIRKYRFEERAAGGEWVVWHSILQDGPALIRDYVVRYYDQSRDDRVSIEHFDRWTAARKMWTYLCYLRRFRTELLRLAPERFAMIALETAKWAILARERSLAARLVIAAAPHGRLTHTVKTAVQLGVPSRVLARVRAAWAGRR